MDAERDRDVGDDWERDDAMARESHPCGAGAYEAPMGRVPPPCGRDASYFLDEKGLYLCASCAKEAADMGGYEPELLDE